MLRKLKIPWKCVSCCWLYKTSVRKCAVAHKQPRYISLHCLFCNVERRQKNTFSVPKLPNIVNSLRRINIDISRRQKGVLDQLDSQVVVAERRRQEAELEAEQLEEAKLQLEEAVKGLEQERDAMTKQMQQEEFQMAK